MLEYMHLPQRIENFDGMTVCLLDCLLVRLCLLLNLSVPIFSSFSRLDSEWGTKEQQSKTARWKAEWVFYFAMLIV